MFSRFISYLRSGLNINVCPIPVKTNVGQIDLVLRLSDGTNEKIRDSQACRLFYLNSQRNTNFSGSFQPDQEKACNICPFQGVNISQKPKSSPLSYFAQKTRLHLAPN
jgi:hypothetical protein